MQEDRRKRAEGIAEVLQRCIGEAGLKVELARNEYEITIAARERDDDEGITVVAQVSLRRAKPFGIGAIDHEVRKVRSSQIVTRPSLGTQAASGAPPDESQIP